ncbi:unnamed protein product, partial [marine sediment metagenome]
NTYQELNPGKRIKLESVLEKQIYLLYCKNTTNIKTLLILFKK